MRKKCAKAREISVLRQTGEFQGGNWNLAIGGTFCLCAAQAKCPMSDILDSVPDWLKSLHHMENELRRSARHGLIFRWKEACEHLSEARGHLEQAMREAKGAEPPDGPRTPLRKEGEF